MAKTEVNGSVELRKFGTIPNILDLPEGCKFCTRCDLVEERCHTDEPPLVELSPDHFVRCHVVAEGEIG